MKISKKDLMLVCINRLEKSSSIDHVELQTLKWLVENCNNCNDAEYTVERCSEETCCMNEES